MFVGHVGAGLVLRAYEPRVNAGVLVFAALFSDVLLWMLVLAGVEQVHVPPDFAGRKFLTFTFPWSHGLVASILWSGLGFAAARLALKNTRAAVFVGAALFSHVALDLLVHRPEVPVLGPGSPMLGLGLPLGEGLLIEFLLAMGGLSYYLLITAEGRQSRRVGMAVLIFSMTAMTIGGQLTAKEAPPVRFAAVSSLITIGVVSGIAGLLDRGVTKAVGAGPSP